MSSIPGEMYHEILLRLPVKSLLICRSVCKNWYALISTSDFVKLHLDFETQKKNHMLMLEGSNRVLKSVSCDSLVSPMCEVEDAAIEMDYPFKSLHYLVRLVGSCNGLVCIEFVDDDDRENDFLCLWNPATREYKEIPKSPIQRNSMCALGYDHKNDDYKLTVGVTQGTTDTTLVQVYSLASNSWKPGQTVPYRFPDYYMFKQRHGVLSNGDLHWLVRAQDTIFLLSLNISDESFKELQLLPKELLEKNKNPCMILGLLEGCLCLLVNSYVNGIKIHCEVWEMLDYGVQNSWTRRYIISHRGVTFLNPVWSFENGKILFKSYGSLVLYDLEHGSARVLNKQGSTRLAVSYFESLVSLKSGAYVGGEGRIEELREPEED